MMLDEYYAYLASMKGPEFLIPHFDSFFGEPTSATTLLFLESPGPQVRDTRLISLNNDDPTARNLKDQLDKAKVSLENVLLWNIVPWIRKEEKGFDVPVKKDIVEARDYHIQLFKILPQLRALVFLGKRAQSDIVYYSGHTNYRLLAAHHPSAQAMSVATRRDENITVFRQLNVANS
jgi:uracil-DNA glycosylase